MTPPRKHSLSVRAVARDVASAYRAHWFFLITTAIIVLLPQALADSLLDHLNVEGIHSARDVAVVVAVPLTIIVNLFGQAFYAGLAAAAVIEWRAGRSLPGFRALLRSVPIGRLVLLDIVLTLGTAVGLVLLVIPGLIFMAFFSISPALVKFEHDGVWSSMRRSRELVRGNFWRVMVTVVGTILAHRDRRLADQCALPWARHRHLRGPGSRRAAPADRGARDRRRRPCPARAPR